MNTVKSETTPPPLPALRAGIVSRVVSDRISSGHSNIGKKDFLAAHFDRVKNIKNALSEFLMVHYQDWDDKEFRKRADKEFLYLALPPYPVLSAWEMQKLYRDVVWPRCEQALKSARKRIRFTARGKAPKVVFGAYKWRIKYRATVSRSPLVRVLQYASQCDPVDFNPDKLPPALREHWMRITGKFGADRISRLLLMHRRRWFTPPAAPQFTTGSYIKAAQFNKASAKPVWHSYWKRDESNTQYQDWYVFKSPQFADHENSAIYLPLMVNYGYHHKDYDLRTEHYVSLNAKGEINIGLAYADEVILPDFQKVIGVDANIVSNQLADSQGRMVTMDGGQWIGKAVPVFEKHEAKGTANLTHHELRTQQKLNAERDCLIRKMIGESLRFYKEQGITDLIVEQLTFYLGSVGSTVMNKLLRRFRLSTLKRWFREQAHKLGMRIHDLPASFSSQACECGHVDAGNRKTQAVFLCTVCGARHNADTHAAGNTERLFHLAADVLLQGGFVTVNEFGEYTCTSKAHKEYSKLKSIYEEIGRCVREVSNDQTHYAYLTGVKNQKSLACKRHSG